MRGWGEEEIGLFQIPREWILLFLDRYHPKTTITIPVNLFRIWVKERKRKADHQIYILACLINGMKSISNQLLKRGIEGKELMQELMRMHTQIGTGRSKKHA